ncbi:MAG: hypothetical protein ACTSPA_00405 [Promethearchaeota archaeon]
MPIGICLWEWDARSGAEILGTWPMDVKLENKTLMQLYSQHLYSAKADIVSMYVGSLNVLSIWTGSIHNYFLTILLQQDEDPENFSDIISDTMYYLVPYIQKDIFKPIMPSIYQRFKEYPNTNLEQRRAILYSNELNRGILNLLQEEGIYYKDELKIWLEDSLKKKAFNYEMAIERLSHNDLIKVSSVKGVEGTYVFLINDIVLLRGPPVDLIQTFQVKGDNKLNEDILSKIRDFFKYYKPSERDNLQILKFLNDSNYYKIIDFLRKTNADESTLKKLTIHGVDNVFTLINDLENLDIVDSAKNMNEDLIYFLKSDIIIDKLTPNFMMRKLYDMNYEGNKNPKLIQSYIKILKESFYDNSLKKGKLKKTDVGIVMEDIPA